MDKNGTKRLIFCVEVISSKQKDKGKTWSRGTNLRLPFALNATLNLSIDKEY